MSLKNTKTHTTNSLLLVSAEGWPLGLQALRDSVLSGNWYIWDPRMAVVRRNGINKTDNH